MTCANALTHSHSIDCCAVWPCGRARRSLSAVQEIIEKEYEEFNHKNSTRKQKKLVPALFYSFYRSELCANFVLACHAYLVQFVRSPVQAGERLDGSGSDSSRDTAKHDSNEGGRKLVALQSALHRVSECWAGILMYRSEMNRYETITVSRTSKKSEHFLNDTYDSLFFETLYLLVEYLLEFRFLDHSRSHLYQIATDFVAVPPSSSGFSTAMPSPAPSPSSAAATAASAAAAATASAGGNLAAAVAAPVAPPKVKSTASAAAIAASVESNWRIVQHELQRILRSRNFNFSMRKRAPSSNFRGNGLNHIPLASSTLQGSGGGPGAQARRPAISQSMGKHGASYRSPATFRLDGAPRSWDDDPADSPIEDDTRALSHLPGQFKTRGSFGILDCLDLRSPMIASMLPNPRTMRSANEAYVFGAEQRRASASRSSSRLTHAEAKYLKAQHALQAQRALEWKVRLEREEREERTKEEEEEQARQARAGQPRLEEEKTEIAIVPIQTVPISSEGPAVDAAATAAAAAAVAAAHTVAAVAAAPVPPLQLQPRPPAYPPRPTPPHHNSTGTASAAAVAADAFPLQPSPPVSGSASARSRPLRPASQPPSSSAYPAGSQTTRAGRLQPIAGYGAVPAAVSAAPSPRTRLTLDEALNSTKPLIQINGNRISLVDFQI